MLKLNAKFDAGDIYVQGRVEGIDPGKDLHCYIGHKAIIDSLPAVESFLGDLAKEVHCAIKPQSAIDKYYSYPTGTKLFKILMKRLRRHVMKARRKSATPEKQPKFKRALTSSEPPSVSALSANDSGVGVSEAH
jgi:hypothetical protein